MTWTPERIAEFEMACDLRQLRRDNPMPGLATVEQATAIVRHTLIGYATPPDGELACTADRAAAHVVQALRDGYLLHLAGADPHPRRPAPATDRPETPLAAIARERESQDGKWGEQNHPDGTGGRYTTTAADAARQACDLAAKTGGLTWRHILHEEVSEAFAETDPDRLRAELVQVAAVAVAWLEAIDRRTGQ